MTDVIQFKYKQGYDPVMIENSKIELFATI